MLSPLYKWRNNYNGYQSLKAKTTIGNVEEVFYFQFTILFSCITFINQAFPAGTQNWNNVSSMLIHRQDVQFPIDNIETTSIQRLFNAKTMNQRWTAMFQRFVTVMFQCFVLWNRCWFDVFFQRCVPAGLLFCGWKYDKIEECSINSVPRSRNQIF